VARSLLASLVRGTRQMLAVQLIISVIVVAVAGWTLAIMSNVMHERDQLQARVVQLEAALGAQGVVVPPKPATLDQSEASRDANAYPPPVGSLRANTGLQVVAARRERAAPISRDFDPTRVLRDIFTPPPPMHALVLHVRGDADANVAQQVVREMQRSALSVIVDVLGEHDQRPSGYAYFDGRQSLAAAALVSHFNDAARQAGVALWSAQLTGVALPAQGEYTADRLDIVLPSLPAPAPAPIAAAAPSAAHP